MQAMGVLPSFTGIAVHDVWAGSDTYTAPERQLCCAHALRELQAVTDCARRCMVVPGGPGRRGAHRYAAAGEQGKRGLGLPHSTPGALRQPLSRSPTATAGRRDREPAVYLVLDGRGDRI